MDNRPGTYALILYSEHAFKLEVGKLGNMTGDAGYYIYCGSAFGPGGVAARVKHHLKITERPHWHIDYLRKLLRLSEVWYCYDSQKREHDWSSILASYPNASMPMYGFGSSDCSCETHLIYLPDQPQFKRLGEKVLKAFPEHWRDSNGAAVLKSDCYL